MNSTLVLPFPGSRQPQNYFTEYKLNKPLSFIISYTKNFAILVTPLLRSMRMNNFFITDHDQWHKQNKSKAKDAVLTANLILWGRNIISFEEISRTITKQTSRHGENSLMASAVIHLNCQNSELSRQKVFGNFANSRLSASNFKSFSQSLKYGSEEMGSSLCRCSSLLGVIMSKNLRGLWFCVLIKVQNATSLVF